MKVKDEGWLGALLPGPTFAWVFFLAVLVDVFFLTDLNSREMTDLYLIIFAGGFFAGLACTVLFTHIIDWIFERRQRK